jgi:hypothetical protein
VTLPGNLFECNFVVKKSERPRKINDSSQICVVFGFLSRNKGICGGDALLRKVNKNMLLVDKNLNLTNDLWLIGPGLP